MLACPAEKKDAQQPTAHRKETERKRSRFALMVLLVCLALPAAILAQEGDPATVINAANDAWNAGDVAALKALYADDPLLVHLTDQHSASWNSPRPKCYAWRHCQAVLSMV